MRKAGVDALESYLIPEIITVIHIINTDLVNMPRKMSTTALCNV
jgi:hypothetical protein